MEDVGTGSLPLLSNILHIDLDHEMILRDSTRHLLIKYWKLDNYLSDLTRCCKSGNYIDCGQGKCNCGECYYKSGNINFGVEAMLSISNILDSKFIDDELQIWKGIQIDGKKCRQISDLSITPRVNLDITKLKRSNTSPII